MTAPRHRLLPAVLAAAAVIAATPAAARAATWSAPQTISHPHTFAGPLALTTTFDGSLVAAWPWQDDVGDDALGGESTAARPAASAFGPEHPAPDGTTAVAPFARTQTLALAAQGLPGRSGPTGAILYRVKAAFGPATGGFGTARTLATAPVIGRPALAAATGGATALIAYIEVTRTATGATRRVIRAIDRRSGAFTAPYTLSGRGRADVLTAAANARGDQVVAFARDGDVLARVRRHGHGWGSIQRLARAAAGSKTQWQLAAGVDDRGQVRVVWRRHQYTRPGVPGRTPIASSALLVGRGTFTAAQTLTATGTTPPALTRTPQGWAVADVETTPDGPRPALHRTHGGSAFGPVEYAAPAAGGLRGAAVVFSPIGGVTVAWVQPLAGQDSDGIARAASLDPGIANAGFGPVEDVSPAEAVHEVGLGADGRAGQPVAVWTARPEGTGPSIPIAQVRTYVRSATRHP
jgi:hypothetical protein